jgi:hypothetical protein
MKTVLLFGSLVAFYVVAVVALAVVDVYFEETT